MILFRWLWQALGTAWMFIYVVALLIGAAAKKYWQLLSGAARWLWDTWESRYPYVTEINDLVIRLVVALLDRGLIAESDLEKTSNWEYLKPYIDAARKDQINAIKFSSRP